VAAAGYLLQPMVECYRFRRFNNGRADFSRLPDQAEEYAMRRRHHFGKLSPLLILGWLTLFAAPVRAEPVRVGIISDSATSWPLRVALEKNFFTQEGIEVEVAIEVDSGKLLAGVADGKYHISHQASDHFIRGVQEGKPVFIFMTISRPIFDFVVSPDVRSIADLKGKTIALDRPTTGYWVLFRKVFTEAGVSPDDYKLLPNLGGAEKRFLAVKEGRAQGTFLNPPLSLSAIAQGFPRLTGLKEHFPDLPGSSGGARKDWALKNEKALIAYLRGWKRAVDWLGDPKNRDEAIAIYSKRVKADAEQLAGTYDSFVRDGLVRSKLSMDGMKQMLDLLVESGQMTPEGANPELYAIPGYQERALAAN
jgi:ABC-type nitrate/sulfonate/bicarbonate transport system substrate-binding protein